MASCGEIDHSSSLPSSRKGGGEACSGSGGPSLALAVPECAICLQSCVHPVCLPCRHVFCFLCAKGASRQSKRCALCRQEVPEDFLERPALLSPEELKASAGGHAWYYEGRNGWWQYDQRSGRELEDAFARGKKSAEMLIAGFLYVADLEAMVQYRRNEHGRRRKIKRDVADIPKKGVAGLRLDADAPGSRAAGARPASSPGGQSARPSADDGPSLEGALGQLQVSRGAARERAGEGEEAAPSRGYSAPNASADESAAGSSGEDGEGDDDDEEVQTRQRLQSTEDGSPPGAESSRGSVGSRRPDGQCTVTEV